MPSTRDGRLLGRARCGLTLLELLLSLTVSALVLLAASGIAASLADAHSVVERAMSRSISDLGGERLLRQLVGALDIEGGPRMSYAGPGDTLRFQSWCPTARGWHDRCRVTVVAQDSLVVTYGRLRMRAGVSTHAVALLFLRAPNDGGQWTDAWRDSLQVPYGIGVVRQGVATRDTMILRIVARG